MCKIKKLINIITNISIILFFSSCDMERYEKEFMIDNVHKLKKVSDNSFVIENLDGYYTEKSISFQSDSSFTIICWGDRNSFWWNIRKDKKITVSIPYDRYKGKNIHLDLEILKKFKMEYK